MKRVLSAVETRDPLADVTILVAGSMGVGQRRGAAPDPKAVRILEEELTSQGQSFAEGP